MDISQVGFSIISSSLPTVTHFIDKHTSSRVVAPFCSHTLIAQTRLRFHSRGNFMKYSRAFFSRLCETSAA